jgi:hypothetical protein
VGGIYIYIYVYILAAARTSVPARTIPHSYFSKICKAEAMCGETRQKGLGVEEKNAWPHATDGADFGHLSCIVRDGPGGTRPTS